MMLSTNDVITLKDKKSTLDERDSVLSKLYEDVKKIHKIF